MVVASGIWVIPNPTQPALVRPSRSKAGGERGALWVLLANPRYEVGFATRASPIGSGVNPERDPVTGSPRFPLSKKAGSREGLALKGDGEESRPAVDRRYLERSAIRQEGGHRDRRPLPNRPEGGAGRHRAPSNQGHDGHPKASTTGLHRQGGSLARDRERIAERVEHQHVTGRRARG